MKEVWKTLFPVFVGVVIAILVYTLWKYRRKGELESFEDGSGSATLAVYPHALQVREALDKKRAAKKGLYTEGFSPVRALFKGVQKHKSYTEGFQAAGTVGKNIFVQTPLDYFYDVFEEEQLEVLDKPEKPEEIAVQEEELPNFGAALGRFDSEVVDIPWDSDNKDLLQKDITWGIISNEASKALFLKTYHRELFGNPNNMLVRESGRSEYYSPMMNVYVEDPGSMKGAQIGESLVAAGGGMIVGEVLEATVTFFAKEGMRAAKDTAGNIMKDAAGNTIMETYKKQRNLDDLVRKASAKLEGSKLVQSAKRTVAPIGKVLKTLGETAKRILGINKAKGLLKKIGKAIGKIFAKSLGKLVSKYFIKSVLIKVISAAAVAAATACVVATFGACAPLLAFVTGQSVAINTFLMVFDIVILAVVSIMTPILSKLFDSNGICPAGSRPIDQVIPDVVYFIITSILPMGDIIDLLGPYLCVFNSGEPRMKERLFMPGYFEDSTLSMYYRYWPDAELPRGSSKERKMPPVPSGYQCVNDKCYGQCPEGTYAEGKVEITCFKHEYPIVGRVETKTFHGTVQCKEGEQVLNGLCYPRCPVNYTTQQIAGTGGYKCSSKGDTVARPIMEYKPIEVEDPGLQAPSFEQISFPYCDFGSKVMLDKMIKFYNDAAWRTQSVVDASGNVEVEYIVKIYGVVASSELSCDVVCGMKKVQFHPITGAGYKEIDDREPDKWGNKRAYRRFYFIKGPDDPRGVFTVTGCTNTDYTAPDAMKDSSEALTDGEEYVPSMPKVFDVINKSQQPPIDIREIFSSIGIAATSFAVGMGVGKAIGGGKGIRGLIKQLVPTLAGAGTGIAMSEMNQVLNPGSTVVPPGLSSYTLGQLRMAAKFAEFYQSALANPPLPGATYEGQDAFVIPGAEGDDNFYLATDNKYVSIARGVIVEQAAGYAPTLDVCQPVKIGYETCSYKYMVRDMVNKYHAENPTKRIKKLMKIEPRGKNGCYYGWKETTYNPDENTEGTELVDKEIILAFNQNDPNTCVFTPGEFDDKMDAYAVRKLEIAGGLSQFNKEYVNWIHPVSIFSSHTSVRLDVAAMDFDVVSQYPITAGTMVTFRINEPYTFENAYIGFKTNPTVSRSTALTNKNNTDKMYYLEAVTGMSQQALLFAGNAESNLSIANDEDLRIGTGDFTIEWFQYMQPGNAANARVFSVGTHPSASIAVSIEGNSDTSKMFYFWLNGTITTIESNANYVNQWIHFAISRQGTNLRFFKNGVQMGSNINSAGNINDTTNMLRIGNQPVTSDGAAFKGYITSFRWTKGTALYTANFTTPTIPLTSLATTDILLTGNTQLKTVSSLDASPVPKTVTNTGVTIGQFQGRDAYLFAGTTTSTLSIPNDDDLRLRTGDFTIEWFQYMQTGQNAAARVFSVGTWSSASIAVSLEGSSDTSKSFNLWLNGTITTIESTKDYTNQWIHFAISRQGRNLRFFKNGVQMGSTIDSAGDINNTSDVLRIGGESSVATNGSTTFKGGITNFRWIKGTALYTANFTVPTTPLTAVPNTKILLLGTAARNTTFSTMDTSSMIKTVMNNNVIVTNTTGFRLRPFIYSDTAVASKFSTTPLRDGDSDATFTKENTFALYYDGVNMKVFRDEKEKASVPVTLGSSDSLYLFLGGSRGVEFMDINMTTGGEGQEIVSPQTNYFTRREMKKADMDTGLEPFPESVRPEVFAIGPCAEDGYQYTKQEAQQKCESYGARLATYRELVDAQLAGADWCCAGWLYDRNFPYFPITTRTAECGGGTSGVKMYESARAAANCYGVKPVIGTSPAIQNFDEDTYALYPQVTTALPIRPFEIPFSLPVKTTLGGAKCPKRTCQDTDQIEKLVTDFNAAYTDKKILKVSKAWTPKPNRCDYEVEMLRTFTDNAVDKTVLSKETLRIDVQESTETPCLFTRIGDGSSSLNSGTFIMASTPTVGMDASGEDVSGDIYTSQFLLRSEEGTMKTNLLPVIQAQRDLNASIGKPVDDARKAANETLRVVGDNIGFRVCGEKKCSDPDLLARMMHAYNSQNGFKEPFGAERNIMRKINRAAASGPDSCDVQFENIYEYNEDVLYSPDESSIETKNYRFKLDFSKGCSMIEPATMTEISSENALAFASSKSVLTTPFTKGSCDFKCMNPDVLRALKAALDTKYTATGKISNFHTVINSFRFGNETCEYKMLKHVTTRNPLTGKNVVAKNVETVVSASIKHDPVNCSFSIVGATEFLEDEIQVKVNKATFEEEYHMFGKAVTLPALYTYDDSEASKKVSTAIYKIV